MNDIFIKHLEIKTSEKLIELAKEYGYNFYSTFKNKSLNYIIDEFYKYNHGNSKILFHFYYNDIINKFEITLTSNTIKNTYPQLKNIPITYYFGTGDPFI